MTEVTPGVPPLSARAQAADGGVLETIRGRGVITVVATDAAGRRVALVFDVDVLAEGLLGDLGAQVAAAREARRIPAAPAVNDDGWCDKDYCFGDDHSMCG